MRGFNGIPGARGNIGEAGNPGEPGQRGPPGARVCTSTGMWEACVGQLRRRPSHHMCTKRMWYIYGDIEVANSVTVCFLSLSAFALRAEIVVVKEYRINSKFVLYFAGTIP